MLTDKPTAVFQLSERTETDNVCQNDDERLLRCIVTWRRQDVAISAATWKLKLPQLVKFHAY